MKKIILLGNPLSTGSIYRNHGHIMFTTKKAKELKADYQRQAKEQWKGEALNEHLEISVSLYFGDKRTRDWDNYHKLSMDALTGIVWQDDSLIQKATIEKYYDKEKPRLEIEIKKV